LAIAWTILMIALGYIDNRRFNNTSLEIATASAKETFNRDLVYRRWASQHGGVYVPETDSTPPNPYLSHISERDITTPSGKKLTLVNPAYMTRQVHELGANQYGLRGHITSLNPLRPINEPDRWEKDVLQSFDQGVTEVISFDTIGSEVFLRYMRPMMTEQGCLKCHAFQGYQAGDVRGGISVSFPWSPMEKRIQSHLVFTFLMYGSIWLIGLFGIWASWSRIKMQITRRLKAEESLLINEKKSAEEILERNNQLIKINAEKDKFLSIVTHDLRSPFNAFLGLTQVLVERLPSMKPEEIEKIAFSMQRSATNLYRLLEELLEWSRIQRGVAGFNPDFFLLRPKITESISMIQELADKKEIGIYSEIPTEIMVYADVHMLETVIRNLVSNAIKFTRKGGKITIKANETSNQGITISITDTGIGLNNELLSKLFELGEETGRRGTDGEATTGLGLIICKEFIEKHGGKIWAESEEGKGSTFKFTLPGEGRGT